MEQGFPILPGGEFGPNLDFLKICNPYYDCDPYPFSVFPDLRPFFLEWNFMSLKLAHHLFQSKIGLLSRQLTYPPKKGTFADDFPFPKVGYVSFLE